MNENLKALLKALDEDEELLAAYRAVIVAFANDHGYELTVEDLRPAEGAGLEEDDLAIVVGGFRFDCQQNYLGPYPGNRTKPVRIP